MTGNDEIFICGAEYFANFLKENKDEDGYILAADLDILLQYFKDEQVINYD